MTGKLSIESFGFYILYVCCWNARCSRPCLLWLRYQTRMVSIFPQFFSFVRKVIDGF